MQNIYEFSPNTVGILGDLSFSKFKTLRIANLLKERKLSVSITQITIPPKHKC